MSDFEIGIIHIKRIHIVPGVDNSANGIAVAAKLIADTQGAVVLDCSRVADMHVVTGDEVWVHSMWTPQVWGACWSALRSGATLVRMTHGCLDPLRVAYHGWRKRLVAPIERWLFAHCGRIVVTGEWEAAWCRKWGVEGPFEIMDLMRFFSVAGGCTSDVVRRDGAQLHLLYLGRRHPLKGLSLLEKAVDQVSHGLVQSLNFPDAPMPRSISFRAISDAFGEAKEKIWSWCDVLVLPTLSENFGLVVAEALERGKFVITTDGAPAWSDYFAAHPERGIYLEGYRNGTDVMRISALKEALQSIVQRGVAV